MGAYIGKGCSHVVIHRNSYKCIGPHMDQDCGCLLSRCCQPVPQGYSAVVTPTQQVEYTDTSGPTNPKQVSGWTAVPLLVSLEILLFANPQNPATARGSL